MFHKTFMLQTYTKKREPPHICRDFFGPIGLIIARLPAATGHERLAHQPSLGRNGMHNTYKMRLCRLEGGGTFAANY